jgi:long-chain acyl-CoA synthetase
MELFLPRRRRQAQATQRGKKSLGALTIQGVAHTVTSPYLRVRRETRVMGAVKFENLVEMFERSVKEYGPRDLFGTVKDGNWEWTTYAQVGEMVDAFRGGLAALGIKHGDNVCIISNNRVEWAVAAYACYGLGAALVPMYEAQLPKEWEFIADDCGAVAIIVASRGDLRQGEGDPRRRAEREAPHQALRRRERREELRRRCSRPARKNPEPVDPARAERHRLPHLHVRHDGQPEGRHPLARQHHLERQRRARTCCRSAPTIAASRSALGALVRPHRRAARHALEGRDRSRSAEAVDKIIANLAEVQPTILFSVPRIFNRIYDNVNKKMAERPAIDPGLVPRGDARREQAPPGAEPVARREAIAPHRQELVFSKVARCSAGDSSTPSAAALPSRVTSPSSSTTSASPSTRATASPRPAPSRRPTGPARTASAASARRSRT